MRARPDMSCLLLATQVAWVLIAGCSGKGAGPATGGLGGDAAAAGSSGSNAGGDSASSTTTGVAAGGAFGSGGVNSTDALASGGVSGTNTVIDCTSTTCAAHDDGGTDGVSGECGEPVTKACYAACRESKDEASCSERGGTWRTESSGMGGTCVCPTGEGGRPCTASSDCLGDCSAWMDPMQGSGTWCQQYVTSFTCSSEGGKQGCWCRPEEPFAVCFP